MVDPEQISGVLGAVDGEAEAADQESISSQVLELRRQLCPDLIGVGLERGCGFHSAAQHVTDSLKSYKKAGHV